MGSSSPDHTLFLAHRDAIEKALRGAVVRHRLAEDEAEDFCQSVRLKLIEDDCRILAGFAGRSSLDTFLRIVVERQLLDWRTARWGKWRPSAEAERLGPDACLLERLTGRDGLSLDEATQAMRINFKCPLSADAIAALAARLSPRTTRHFEPAEALAHLPAPGDNPEEQLAQTEQDAYRARLTNALAAELAALSPEDRLLLRLRFRERLKIVTIARTLGLTPKSLYARLERLLARLRRALHAQGLEWPWDGPGTVSPARGEPEMEP